MKGNKARRISLVSMAIISENVLLTICGWPKFTELVEILF